MSKKHDETRYRIEPLSVKHDRAAFSCGVEALDRYLQKQAGQDISRRVAAAFVITPDGTTIAGFYTLSAHLVNLADLPENVAKKLPRYPNVPATLLGRLAVSENFRGQGIGELLLLDALQRALGNTRKSLRQSLLWTRKTNERVDSIYATISYRFPHNPIVSSIP